MGAVLRDQRAFARVDLRDRTLRAFGSVDLGEALAAGVRSVEVVLGGRARAIRLRLLDRHGVLRVAAAIGDASRGAEEIPDAPGAIPLPDATHLEPLALGMFPLTARGVAFGLIEVVAPHEAIEDASPTLEAIAAQSALLLASITSEHPRPADEVATPARAIDRGELVMRILHAGGPTAAVEEALEIVAGVGAPVVGWLARPAAADFDLVGVRGVPPATREEIARAHRLMPWRRLGSKSRFGVRTEIAALLGTPTSHAVDAGDAVLIVGGAPDGSTRRTLDLVAVVLAHVLQHRHAVQDAAAERGRLDLAFARAGHEIRGPIAGARMAIERLLWSGEGSSEQRDVLRRTGLELRELSLMVDGLLRLGTSGALSKRQINLAAAVRKAAEAAAAERGEDRVIVRAQGRVPVRADARQMRTAVLNLIRNALSYSPAEAPVEVTVGCGEGAAFVVVEDQGHGLPEDHAALFEPLVRGAAADRAPEGKGLGLFIAKQVVEAHGGKIWAEPGRRGGAAFHIELPTKRRTSCGH